MHCGGGTVRPQEAALPEDDELMELKLKLEKDDLLGSAIGELSSFSETGESQCQLDELCCKTSDI